MALPIQTNADDAVKVCKYLRTKSTGAAVADVAAIVGATYTDTRKLTAYEAWGLVERSGASISATPLGRQLGQATDDSVVNKTFASVVVSVPAYRKAVEYIRSQGLNDLTGVDLGAWWHLHMSQDLGHTSEKSIASAVNSFFSVASAAGIGVFKVGRQGASTRLESISTQRAAEVLDGTAPVTIPAPSAPVEEGDAEEAGVSTIDMTPPFQSPGGSQTSEITRVFIAHGKDVAIVQQISDMLTASGLQPEVAEEEETTAIPVPDKVFEAMHRCQAAIICVTREPGDDAGTHINQNVLIEIGAAFVLYERQVILVWDKSLSVPSNLQGLYRCELESNKLSWDEGVKLLRAIGKFKADAAA